MLAYAPLLQGIARPHVVHDTVTPILHDTVRVLVHDTTFVLQSDKLRWTDVASLALTFGLVVAAVVAIGVEIWRERVRQREEAQDQAAVASTLLEETRRVRSELGPPPPKAGVVALPKSGTVPKVHPWVQGIITKIALTNAAIVGEFLRLDRALHNCRVACQEVERAQAAQEQAFALRDKIAGTYKGTDVNVAEEISDYTTANRDAQIAAQNVGTVLGLADLAYAGCHRTLDRLETLLKPIAGVP